MSDYSKNNTNFYDLLPEVYKNDFTKSMFNNLFNRYVTKDELEHVNGYIGTGNPNAAINRKIKEHTPHRQAFQLQPMLYSKFGTVEHMMTWKDALNEMHNIGIDTDKLKEWLTPQKFNWVPPLDPDKLLNYQDYYWYNLSKPNDIPQYLTIKNLCNVVEAKVVVYEKILRSAGETFQIIDINIVDNTITINEDKSTVFSKDFVFYIKNSSNSSINNSYQTTNSVEYDINTDSTIITVQSDLTDSLVSGIISLTEFSEILKIERDCICTGSTGFDKSLFDDNQIGSILWNNQLLTDISYSSLVDWNNAAISYELWYDTSVDILYQSNGLDTTDMNNWIIVHQNFSFILDKTEGQHFFDLSIGCTYPQNQWVDQNYWVHKSVIPNFANAKQASIPIIEFNPYLELNEWTCTDYQWSYRENIYNDFEISNNKPTLIELIDIEDYKIEPGYISLHSKHGDQSDTFIQNYNFNILDSIGALYVITNLTTGFGGTFSVIGDITNEYFGTNDPNPNTKQLPSIFKIRNSPNGLLDGEWTIDVVSYDIIADKSTITIISTESISSFSFTGSEIYQSNNGEYISEYSEYKRVKTSYQLDGSPNTNANIINVVGNILDDKDFTGFFETDLGIFSYDSVIYDNGTDITTINVHEDVSLLSNITEIYLNQFRTVIKVNNTFNLYNDSSRLGTLVTSKNHQWLGPDVHWVYDNISNTRPINRQNILPGLSLDRPIQYSSNAYGTGIYDDNSFEYKLNRFVEYYFIKDINGLDIFELHSSLHNIALKDANSIRVYVRDIESNQYIRQYGKYTENIDNNGYVDGITFDYILSRYSEIKIEVGPIIIEDIGIANINVRMEQDDSIFDLDPIANSKNVKLYVYDKHEQVKDSVNQYPLFDIYDTNGNSLKDISQIFSFKEDSDYSINYDVNRRIVTLNNDYEFIQGLLNTYTNELYTYRDNNIAHSNYFVNTNTDEVYVWKNYTWNSKNLLDDYYINNIVSEIEPSGPVIGLIWYNPETELLYKYNGSSFDSIAFDKSTVDPTLKTIWQPGLNDEKYEPKYVDENKNEITIGSEDGQWEIPDPLYYNVHHENRSEISLLYLTEHFNSIINSQEPIPGFNDAANNTFHINSNPNYGLGGTIREYNDGFDILLANLFLESSTTEKIIEFAQNQYSSLLSTVKELFIRNLTEYLTDITITSSEELTNSIIDDVIFKYESLDNMALLYHDSPTFSVLKNWIATLPLFGLSSYIEPYIIESNNEYLLRHHDNHISNNLISNNVKENMIVKILKSVDNRDQAGLTFGNNKSQYSLDLPENIIDYFSMYDATIIANGKYWYSTQNGTRKLFRLNIKEITPIQPGFGYNVDDKWYDTQSDTLYKFDGSNWIIVTSLNDGIILSAWDKIDLDLINTQIILDIETKLYSIIDQEQDVLDLSTIKSNTTYNDCTYNEFVKYSSNRDIVNPLSQIGIYDQNDAFTWNYIKSDLQTIPYIGSIVGTDIGGCWQDVYEKIYGTAFPHLEPWILQGYTFKPSWWDTEYKATDGSRIWKSGMWTNVLSGIIPLGYNLPNNTLSAGTPGEVQTYNFLSVMIDDNPIGQYKPDELLPPFWDHRSYLGQSYSGPIRSLYYNFSSQIISPNLDYKFNDAGTQEWIWINSVEYNYDLLKIFFKIDPLKFYYNTFGIKYNIINKLQIDRDTKHVYSHTDGVFHGDIFDNNKIFDILGVNQWYTNYNRYYNIDNETSNFKSLWRDFTTPLTYQFGSFIDTESIDIQNKNFDLVDNDLDITMKKSLGISDSHIDAINISVLKIPNTKVSYSTSYDWSFDLYANISRNIEYYDVKNYPISIINNTCKLYTFEILDINSINNIITISGDWTHIFNTFEIENSTNNDGIYTTDNVLYDVTLNTTVIKTNESISDTAIDGFISNQYRKHGWETGQEVIFESTKTLPVPFIENETYYIIKIDDYNFQLAENRTDAANSNYILFDTIGTGQLFIGELLKTFNALSSINNPEIWKSYAIDKSNMLSFNTFKSLYGIQNVVNIIEGYASKLEDDGWTINHDNIEVDDILGRTISWQLEIEQFINELSIIQQNKFQTTDDYEFESVSNELNFTRFNPSWSTGTKILLNSLDLPEPLLKNIPYYIIRTDDANVFKLATSISNAKNDISIIILSDGSLSTIESYNVNKSVYVFEINPFRNSIWFKNDIGIISNIITGPFKDINIDNTIYDQNGNVLNNDKISIYREDDIAKIKLNTYASINDIHLSGFHIFLDGYEHIILFENYSSEGFLIYDPYIGLNNGRFDLIYDKQPNHTLRPNIGGKFLSNKSEFISNIESLTKNLENAYSTYSTSESNKMTDLARKGLGYNKTEQQFLDKLEINDKSQFIFWKGLIQHKGSTNAITAFINSRRFLDAKVDEYWFYKLGEFGDAKIKIYPEIHISPNDTLSNELKIEFNKGGESVEHNFKSITINDKDLWFEYPNQQADLSKLGEQFYFNTEITDVYPNENNLLNTSFDVNGSPVDPSDKLWFINGSYFFKTDKPFDSVIISIENDILEESVDYELINSKIIKFYNDPNDYIDLKINILNLAKSKHNPLKIMDYKADVKLLDLPIWDPGKNHHYHITENLINLKRDNDPAEYSDMILHPNPDNKLDPWSNTHTDKVWLDTALLEYYPYYDSKIESSTSERIRRWGSIADFSKISLYQWTESNIHPEEWNDIAALEEIDKTINESIRKSGTVRELIFNHTTNSYEKDNMIFNEYHILDNTLIHNIDSLIVDSIDQSEIDEYIEKIRPKYNIKGYINNEFSVNIEFIQTINVTNTTIDISLTFVDVNDIDLKTIIWESYDVVENGVRIYPTEEELDNNDYSIDVPYTKIITKNKDFSDNITYYYWVKNKSIKINKLLTMIEIERDMKVIPIPYAFMQNHLKNENGLPNRYNQVILKGLADKINDYNRYKLRFVHDFSLRDNIDDGNSSLDIKTIHTEWKLFREYQPYHIDRYLWDKVIESVLETTLNGSNRVPLLDKELYDITYGTDTRYGIKPGQIFADKELIIDAIYTDLYNPDYEFFPVDIDSFIQSNNFDTPENSLKFLEDIFNKFASEHVNRIFFSILHIAFSKKLKYDDIQKSSMISLHGIRILESQGIYDD